MQINSKKMPNTSEAETNLIMIKVAVNAGKLEIIKSKSINTPFDSKLLIYLKSFMLKKKLKLNTKQLRRIK